MNSEASVRRRWWAALGCGLAMSLAGCADFSRGPTAASEPDGAATSDAGGASDGAAPEGGGGTSFARDVEPLLVPTCQACHAPGGQAADTRLLLTGKPAADYTVVVSFVDTSSPSGSRLLSKMSGNGHQGGAVYPATSPEYLTVLRWIEQGALP
jgi:mono/diheme cytochrome c family protein